MITLNETHLIEIKSLMKELRDMPYGKELRHKTLPPSVHHYAICFNNIVDIITRYLTEENRPSIEYLRSIRDNEIRGLFISSDKSLEKYGIHRKMEDLNSTIFMHLSSLIGNSSGE